MLIRSVLTLLLACGAQAAVAACDTGPIRAQAVQDIEYLRRDYARATDAIGSNTPGDIAAGRRVYHRIFRPDAKIGASGIDGISTGPDAWVDVVLGALGPMGPTQHFIGTQVVRIDELAIGPDCRVISGSATMNSHLQAWHTRTDGKVWVVVGNYVDSVAFIPGTGWQIAEMYLERIAEEIR